jgi:hypothetical protein
MLCMKVYIQYLSLSHTQAVSHESIHYICVCEVELQANFENLKEKFSRCQRALKEETEKVRCEYVKHIHTRDQIRLTILGLTTLC